MSNENYSSRNEITPDDISDEITGTDQNGYSRSAAQAAIFKQRLHVNEKTGELEKARSVQDASNVFTPEDFRVAFDTLDGRAITVTFTFNSPDHASLTGLMAILGKFRSLMQEALADAETTGSTMFPTFILTFLPWKYEGTAGASFALPLDYSAIPDSNGDNKCVKITFLMEDAEFGSFDNSELIADESFNKFKEKESLFEDDYKENEEGNSDELWGK